MTRLAPLALLLLGGCVRSLPALPVTYATPAAAPVSCAPQIAVEESNTVPGLERWIAQGLAQHGIPVWLGSPDGLRDELASGRLGSDAVVIRLAVQVTEGVQFVPMTTGSGGHLHWGRANGTLTVSRAGTGEVLTSIALDARSGNADRAVATLVTDIFELFSVHHARDRVPMPAVDDDSLVAAVDQLRAGDWTRGRAALESMAGGHGSDAAHRATYLYLLGIARVFDVAGIERDATVLDRGLEALREAAALEPGNLLFANAVSGAEQRVLEQRLFREQVETCARTARPLRLEAGPAPTGPPGAMHPAPTAPSVR